MTEQRLMEEVLENIRALRQSDTETRVKLAEVMALLQNINSMRSDFEKAQREINDHDLRLASLEGMNIDSRLKKVEGVTFKIMAVILMLVGALECASRIIDFIKKVHP